MTVSKNDLSSLNPLGFTRTKKAFRLFDFSPSTGYRLIKAGRFPPIIRISAGISASRNSDLIKYAADPANYKSEEQA
jgi:predicted DNA-binding transcriptional regulator AlpA